MTWTTIIALGVSALFLVLRESEREKRINLLEQSALALHRATVDHEERLGEIEKNGTENFGSLGSHDTFGKW